MQTPKESPFDSQRHHYKAAIKIAGRYGILKDGESLSNLLLDLHNRVPSDQVVASGFRNNGAVKIATQAMLDYEELFKSYYNIPTIKDIVFPHPMLVLGTMASCPTIPAALFLAKRSTLNTNNPDFEFFDEYNHLNCGKCTWRAIYEDGENYLRGALAEASKIGDNYTEDSPRMSKFLNKELLYVDYSLYSENGSTLVKMGNPLSSFYKTLGLEDAFSELGICSRLMRKFPHNLNEDCMIIATMMEVISATCAGLIFSPYAIYAIVEELSDLKGIPTIIGKEYGKQLSMRISEAIEDTIGIVVDSPFNQLLSPLDLAEDLTLERFGYQKRAVVSGFSRAFPREQELYGLGMERWEPIDKSLQKIGLTCGQPDPGIDGGNILTIPTFSERFAPVERIARKFGMEISYEK